MSSEFCMSKWQGRECVERIEVAFIPPHLEKESLEF
jgi:hypothetical protein